MKKIDQTEINNHYCILCNCLYPKSKLTKIQPKSSNELGKSIYLCKKCITQTLRVIIDKFF